MEKRKYVMLGSLFQKWEYREITVGIGSHIHIEVIIKEAAFPRGPILSCSPVGNNGVYSYRKNSFLPYNRRSVFRCSAAVRMCVPYRQEPDGLKQSILSYWSALGTAACRAGKQEKTNFPV